MASLTYGGVLGAGKGYTVVDTPQGPMTVVGDRAMRNNNPGNLEYHGWQDAYGAIGDDGRFAVFGSRNLGLQAQAHLLFDNRKYANLTLGQAIAAYAPSFENNTAAYAAAVAAASGVSLDTKMKDIPASKQTAVMNAMHAVEGNTQANVYDAQGNLVGTIDTTSPRTPNTAPTPYGPDSQMADTTPGAPIGHVSRAPLGPPAAPSQPGLFAGMATPRGIGTPTATPVDAMRGLAPSAPASAPSLSPAAAATSAAQGLGAVSQATQAARAAQPSMSAAPSGSFTSQDEKTNTGTIANAPNAGNFVSQDERASLAERLGLDPATGIAPAAAPAISPDVAQAAPAIAAPAIAAPKVNVAAAVPAAQPQAVPSAVAAMSRPSLAAPSQPSLSPSDVYGGAVGTAQTSTPGTTVSRVNSYGPSYVTNKYGAVTAVAPDGTMMAALGGVPAAQPSNISGPLGQQQPDQAQPQGLGGLFGPKAKSATGALAGAALGAYALGPLGGLLGGLIGKNMAQGKSPLSGLFGGANSLANTHVVDTFEGPMRAANAVGGLGFPGRPSGPAPGGVAPGMRGLSPGAASAIDHGVGGLY
jgi:YD repeat-containing protein